MTQLHPSSPHSPMGHNSHMPGAAYVYDIEHRSGLAMPTIFVYNIAGTNAVKMGKGIRCPIDTGARVSSAAGGVIEGYDMYGQYIKETVAAAGTSKCAFASITGGPTDALWTNQFGLPYKYAGAAANPNANVTITPPDESTGDMRGTFVWGGTFPAEAEVRYMVDTKLVFGKPYGDRLKSADVGSQTKATSAVIAADGTVTVTIPAAPASAGTVTFPDGATVRFASGATSVVHKLAAVWLSQYMDVMDSAALKRLFAVGHDNTSIKPQYVATVTNNYVSFALANPETMRGTAFAVEPPDDTALNPSPEVAPDHVLYEDTTTPPTDERDDVMPPEPETTPPEPLAPSEGPVTDNLPDTSQPEPLPDEEPRPWLRMTTHAQTDEYLDNHGIDQPAGWGSMSLTQKRAWFDENAANAAT